MKFHAYAKKISRGYVDEFKMRHRSIHINRRKILRWFRIWSQNGISPTRTNFKKLRGWIQNFFFMKIGLHYVILNGFDDENNRLKKNIFKGSCPSQKFQDYILRYPGSRTRLRTKNSCVDGQNGQRISSNFWNFQIISDFAP